MTSLAHRSGLLPVVRDRPAGSRTAAGLRPLAALISTLLHAGALAGALLWLQRAPRPEAAPEVGVQVVWDQPEEGADAASQPAQAPAAPPTVEAPPTPEAPPPPPQATAAAATPPPMPPPPLPRAAAPPPELAPPAPLPQAVPPAEPAPSLAVALPPPPPQAVPPVTLPPPPVPAAEAEPETAEALPLPPPLPAPPAPAPSRPAPVRQAQQAPAAPAATSPGAAAQPEILGGARATGQVVTAPGLLDGVRNPEPDYPLASRQRGERGVVGVVLRLSEAGAVLGVEVVQSSGYPALDESARRAVLRWRFKPATRDGVPVPGTIRTAIHFNLDR
ncbi:MAG: energy transducer TonB [Paracraurococcus sp.]